MKQYLKYLLTKKAKIAYCLFILSFTAVCDYYIINEYLNFEIENPIMLGFAFSILNLVVMPLAMYHPYKEWKDGL